MDILIFGGTFDPPHKSHLQMLKSALRRLKPAHAYVVPAHHSPLKTPAHAPAAERLKMTELALKDSLAKKERRLTAISTFELDRGRMTDTYETLRFFARRHPGDHLHFLLGSDNAVHFRKWKRTSEIRSLCRFLIARRPHTPLPRAGMGLPAHDILPGIFPDVSSTEVRARILAGEDAATWVTPAVRRRITSRGLYGLDIHKRLKRSLPEERYRHSLAVARMAVELALLHDLDIEKAALAGLLHDCGRHIEPSDMARYVQEQHLRVPLASQIARHQPMLFHAHISENVARRDYGIEDPAILSAIRKHTLGDLTMSALDRLIYTADACSDDRPFPEAIRIRRKARTSLQDGFVETLRTKLSYVLRLDRWMHSSGVGLWNKVVGQK